MNDGEREEALLAIVSHYGMVVFMEQLDQIVDRIAKGVLSIPLDKDPEKAALVLYSERMKAEGATAVRNALQNKVQALKSKASRENKK